MSSKKILPIIADSEYWFARNSNESSFLKNHVEFKIKKIGWLTGKFCQIARAQKGMGNSNTQSWLATLSILQADWSIGSKYRVVRSD